MRKFIILTMVTMIFLLVFVAGGLAEQPENKVNVKCDVELTVTNPCTDEDIELSGTANINVKVFLGEDGTTVYGRAHIECHLVSEGEENDIMYIANGIMNLQVESPFNDQIIWECTGIIMITCISEGEEQKFILKATGCMIEISYDSSDPSFMSSIEFYSFTDCKGECFGKP